MNDKKFKIEKYFTTYCTYEVFAENETEAYNKVVAQEINKHEILSNLDRWELADMIEEI